MGDRARIRARLPDEILEATTEIARRRGVSVTRVISELVQDSLTAKGELPAAIYIVTGADFIGAYRKRSDAVTKFEELDGATIRRVTLK